ncbi:MAG: deoxyribodipyrimidine photo-lyase, partial [Steroidobacteraceae bacterium]
MTTALVWFRRDLRLADNPALGAAAAAARHVVPVFIWSPEEEGEWAPGGASRWWLHESLRHLDASLQQRGSRLLLRHGATVDTLLRIAKDSGATQIYWNRRYEPAAIRVEQALTKAMDAAGLIGHGFHSSRLAEPGAVRSASGSPYQIFTPYWRAFLQQVRIEAPEPSPAILPAPAQWPESLPLAELGLLPGIPWHESLALHWQPGETAARAALRQFVEQHLAGYAEHRDLPDAAATSRLSPYLRHGELSPRQIWTAVVKAGERRGLEASAVRDGKFLAELIWREFATQQLVLH